MLRIALTLVLGIGILGVVLGVPRSPQPAFVAAPSPLGDLRVHLQVFSGTPDPSWILHTTVAMHALELLSHEAPVSGGADLTPPEYVALGYRGFALQVSDGMGGWSHPMSVWNNPKLEEFLLTTADANTVPIAAHLLKTRFNSLVDVSMSPSPNHGCNNATGHPYVVGPDTVQPYEPGKWNDDQEIQWNNNCYNYGTNIRTDTFAQPGCGTGKEWEENTCESVVAAIIRDGGVQVESTTDDPSQGHYIAMAIWPNYNFHFYRKDNTGRWSHKPGGTEVRDVDNSGEPISDPAKADRGPYTDFCGYFVAVPSKLQIV